MIRSRLPAAAAEVLPAAVAEEAAEVAAATVSDPLQHIKNPGPYDPGFYLFTTLIYFSSSIAMI